MRPVSVYCAYDQNVEILITQNASTLTLLSPVSLHHCSTIMFILMLLLSDRQVDKAWKPSN
jgi:hypothetical protein